MNAADSYTLVPGMHVWLLLRPWMQGNMEQCQQPGIMCHLQKLSGSHNCLFYEFKPQTQLNCTLFDINDIYDIFFMPLPKDLTFPTWKLYFQMLKHLLICFPLVKITCEMRLFNWCRIMLAVCLHLRRQEVCNNKDNSGFFSSGVGTSENGWQCLLRNWEGIKRSRTNLICMDILP